MFPSTVLNMAPNAAITILFILGKLLFLIYSSLDYIRAFLITQYIVNLLSIREIERFFLITCKGSRLMCNNDWLLIRLKDKVI